MHGDRHNESGERGLVRPPDEMTPITSFAAAIRLAAHFFVVPRLDVRSATSTEGRPVEIAPRMALRRLGAAFVFEGHANPRAERFDLAILELQIQTSDFGDP